MRGDAAPFVQLFVILNFNSRPYVRGDSVSVRNVNLLFNFNSRPYVRGDQAGVLAYGFWIISIHAPT